MSEVIDLKVYNVYVKYVEMVMSDGDVLVYNAYSPFPKGHSAEKAIIKLSLKDAMNKINEMDDNDGLRMDYHGNSAYSPSDVKRVKWGLDDDIAKGMYMIDATGSKEKHDLKSVVNIGNDGYVVSKIIDWTRAFGVKFLLCTKSIKVAQADVEEAIEAVKENLEKT